MAKRKKHKKQGSKPNKTSSSSKNKKTSEADKKELKVDIPASLKALCILSFLGFVYCLVSDTGDYFMYSNFEEIKQGDNQVAYEELETMLANFEKNDLFIDDGGKERDTFLERLSRLAIYRTILDVLAMVGTALMFLRIRKGFYIYGAFQLLYVIVPFAMFGIGAMVIYDKIALIPPLIYLILFTTQFKHLNR